MTITLRSYGVDPLSYSARSIARICAPSTLRAALVQLTYKLKSFFSVLGEANVGQVMQLILGSKAGFAHRSKSSAAVGAYEPSIAEITFPAAVSPMVKTGAKICQF